MFKMFKKFYTYKANKQDVDADKTITTYGYIGVQFWKKLDFVYDAVEAHLGKDGEKWAITDIKRFK